MKNIQYIALLVFTMMLPVGLEAANITFSPALGNYTTGDTFSTSVYVAPGAGESISATKVALTFPADKLEVLSYTPVSGGSILAHVGADFDNTNGTIVDNVAFNPAISASTHVATISFKAKSDGQSQVLVGPDSKLLDTTNADKSTGSSGATYTVSAPAPTPPTAPVTTGSGTGNTAQPAATAPSATGSESQENAEEATTTQEVATTTSTSTNEQLAAAAGVGLFGIGKTAWYYILGILGLLIAIWLFFIAGKKRRRNE